MARIFVIEDEKIADAIEILLEKKKQMCARERSTKSYGSGFIGSCGGSHTNHRSSGFIGSCGGSHVSHSGCGGFVMSGC